jgi:hypothetical protein
MLPFGFAQTLNPRYDPDNRPDLTSKNRIIYESRHNRT